MLSRWNFEPLMGTTYLGGLASLIPSSLFPEKKQWHLGLTALRIVGWSDENHFGLRVSFFGESFLNFGMAGVVLLGIVLGSLFGVGLRFIHLAARSPVPCLWRNLCLVLFLQMLMPLFQHQRRVLLLEPPRPRRPHLDRRRLPARPLPARPLRPPHRAPRPRPRPPMSAAFSVALNGPLLRHPGADRHPGRRLPPLRRRPPHRPPPRPSASSSSPTPASPASGRGPGLPGVEFVDVPFRDWSRGRAQFWEQLAFPRLARARGCAVGHHPITTVPAWHNGVKTVVTLHDLNFYLHPEWYTPQFRAAFALCAVPGIRRADRVVTISDYVRRQAAESLRIPPPASAASTTATVPPPSTTAPPPGAPGTTSCASAPSSRTRTSPG